MSYNRLVNGVLQPIAGSVVTDSTLSATSTNAVQNSAVTTKINEIDSDIESLNNSLSDLELSDFAGGNNKFDFGTDASDYSYRNEIITKLTSNSITMNTISSGSTLVIREHKIKNLNKMTISFSCSCDSSNAKPRIVFRLYDSSGNVLTNSNCSFGTGTYNTYYSGWYYDFDSLGNKSLTFDIPSNVAYWNLGIGANVTAGYVFTYNNIMIQEGSTATDYEPYIPSVKMLAEDVTKVNETLSDLEYVGYEIPSECPLQNDYSNGSYTQKLGRVDLGKLNWSIDSDNNNIYYIDATVIPSIKMPPNNSTSFVGYSSKYDVRSVTAQGTTNNTVAIGNFNPYYTMYVITDGGRPSGYLYYELSSYITNKQEAVVDLSESLVDQGLIAQSASLERQGGYNSSNVYDSSSIDRCSTLAIPCKAGDLVTVKSSDYNICIITFLNSSNAVISRTVATSLVAPTNTASVVIGLQRNSGMTPSNAPKIYVYINNAIDELKNDLSKHTALQPTALTANTAFTCPSDGYVRISADSNGSYVLLTLSGYQLSKVEHIGQSVSQMNATYVRKGQVVNHQGNGSYSASFFPLG